MRRILALVCIFILLLFTGMPMFTSNLLCNQIEVYADEPPNISDNEKIRAAITVFLNSKGAYLSSKGLTMNVVMGCMQENIDHFYPAYALTIGQAYDAAALVLDIGVSTSPLTVVLKAGAVRFFNAFLQWLIDEGKITNTPSGSDGLYSGWGVNGITAYVYSSSSSRNICLYASDIEAFGYPVDGVDSDYIVSLLTNQDYTDVSYITEEKTFTVNYFSDLSLNCKVFYNGGKSITNNAKYPLLQLTTPGYSNILNNTNVSSSAGIIKSRVNVYECNAAFLCRKDNGVNTFYYGYVFHDKQNDTYTLCHSGTIENHSGDINPANINFNKDDFDPTPTTPPTGSDGLTYQPRQTGTGNTYNTYNDYYQDWHEGDTYIYNPGSGGGGSGGDDPGSGGGGSGGTQPPWDGNGSDGLYSTGMTLTPDGNGGYNVNFPDVGLPNLDIDWSINGLKEKFPFSIPWDLMAFFAVMNAEPETPYIKADIPLGIWEWNIDWDLHAFDNIARIMRNMELIGFCIGLILLTRSIIKG